MSENNKLIKEILSSNLSDNEILITKIQRVLSKLGYQWQEHIYNDNVLGAECYLEITNDTEPTFFIKGKMGVGWGRFGRLSCWKQALNYVEQQKPIVSSKIQEKEFIDACIGSGRYIETGFKLKQDQILEIEDILNVSKTKIRKILKNNYPS